MERHFGTRSRHRRARLSRNPRLTLGALSSGAGRDGRIGSVFRPAAEARGLDQAQGHWLRPDLIAWPPADLPPGENPASLDWRLHWSADDHIDPAASEPVPVGGIVPAFRPGRDTGRRGRNAFPHLRNHLALRLSPETAARAPEALRCQVAVSVHLPSGRLVTAGQLQLPGVIDELYAAAQDAELGRDLARRHARPCACGPRPHATSPCCCGRPGLDLHHEPQRHRMIPAPDGTWAITGDSEWRGARYRYEVTVFAPHRRRVVVNEVTDPYSHGADGQLDPFGAGRPRRPDTGARAVARVPVTDGWRTPSTRSSTNCTCATSRSPTAPSRRSCAGASSPRRWTAQAWRTCAGWPRPG